MTCQRGGSLSLTTRDITLKECRTVTTLKYLFRKLFNRLHYILNDPCICILVWNVPCLKTRVQDLE